MSSFPYVATSNIFNTANYNSLENSLTIETANKLYLSLSGGTVVGNINTSNLTATSTINSPQYLLSGSSINMSLIQGITNGIATANKALIVDSSIDITNINTITTSNINISSNITYNGSNINLNLISGITAGTALASKAIILNSSKAIYDIGELSFSTSAANKVVLKKSTTGNGLYLYDTQSSSPAPTISILCANLTSCTYLQMDTASAPNTYSISYLSGSAFTSGLRISCNNSSMAADVNSNVMLAARNGTIPHVVVNDQFNQLHLFPQGLAELNTSYVQNVIIGEELLIRKNLQIGTSQDNATTKLISALDSTQATGTKRYITIGKNNVSNSQGEIYFNYDSSASDASYLGFGQFGKSDQLTIGGNGWVGIATNSPAGPFHVNTTANLAYGAGGTNVYRLRTDNGITEGPAIGPISYNTSAVFNGYIACTAMAMTSDKRLKCNIKDVNFEHIENFYRTVLPKTYNFKYNKTKIEYGFIAQEVIKAGYLDLISMIGNEDLKGVIEDNEVDIDGVQLCLDYQKITMFNTIMIQNLIKKITSLESMIKILKK